MTVFRVLFLLTLALALHGQDDQLKFDHLTVEDGLSHGALYSIVQDSRGFMWFGTRFGLNRYDGHEFKLFSHDPENPSSLPGYKIVALLEDHQNRLWVGTEAGGLGRYDRSTEQFFNYRNDPADSSSLSNDLITCIFEDSEQNLWVGTQNGLNCFDPQGLNMLRYYPNGDLKRPLKASHIAAIAEIKPGILMVGMGDGSMLSLNLHSREFTLRQNNVFWPARTSSRPIKCILKDMEKDFVWVSRFTYGFGKYSLEDGILNFYEYTEDLIGIGFVYSMAQDNNGKIWMATVQGLISFDPQTEQYGVQRYDDQDPHSLAGDINYSVYIDEQGIVWSGSDGKGLSLYKPYPDRFELFRHEASNTHGPSADDVYSIIEGKDGDIWFTTLPGGTNRYNPESGSFRYYQTNDLIPGTWSLNYPQKVILDRYDKAWIGTNIAGLSQVDPRSGHRDHLFYNNQLDSNSLSGHSVLSIHEDSDGAIWVGTKENGLNRYNRDTEDFTSYKHDPDDSTSIGGDRIYAIQEDSQGILWIGSANGGLSRFHEASESFTNYKYSANNQNNPGSNYILDLFEDSQSNLWIGTRGGGLNKLDPARENFSRLDLGFNNVDITIHSIEEDDHGFLWLSSNIGLIKADPEKGFLNRYTQADGLQGNDFYYGSSLKDSHGFLYFGGPNGFNRFHPDSVSNNPHIAPIVITNFQINYEDVPIGAMTDGRTILTQSITETEGIVLGPEDKAISFTFSALDYLDPERNRFAYKLENFNENWIQSGTDHRLTYTSLEPGQYTLHIKGSNNDGIWNEVGVGLAITVLPPFWETWWFRLLLSFSLILLIYIFIRLRLNRIETEKKKLEILVVERTAELKIEIEERQRVETEKMQLKVDHLKRELVSKSVCATQKQEIMNNLFQELKDIQKMDANEMRDRFNGVVRYFKNMFKTEDDWGDFEKWFTEVHIDFFTNLRREIPQLSQSEVKVCALLRLNLVSKDIANIMNVQLNTVDIYRHRIRKKIGLHTEDNLNQHLTQF